MQRGQLYLVLHVTHKVKDESIATGRMEQQLHNTGAEVTCEHSERRTLHILIKRSLITYILGEGFFPPILNVLKHY